MNRSEYRPSGEALSHFRIDRQATGESESCSSTCTVQSTIQWEIGVAVVKIGFAIGGHLKHARRQHVVLLLTL